MLTLPECACEFTYTYGDMEESYYSGAYNNFVAALKFMHKHHLLDDFKLRAKQCVDWASFCGYGFADDSVSVFYDYYME